MKLNVAILLAGACLALTACGGAQTNSDPSLSNEAAATLSLRSDDVERESGGPTYQRDRYNLEAVVYRLRTVCAPLFQHYGLRFGEDFDETRAFSTMLTEVSFVVSNGVVTVTNKATGGVIYTGSLNNVGAGTFDAANIPGGTTQPPPPTTTPDGAALYAATCAGCHGPLASSNLSGKNISISSIKAAGMAHGLSDAQLQAVADTVNGASTPTPPSPPPPPPACTYTTGAWGACQPSGTQSRTVTASPSGCVGTPPASTQACTYVPPVATCTGFTYSTWSACSTSGTQTRTVIASTPTGCTGGSPVLTQSCTYTPPLDGAALYAQSCAGCHGSLASSNLKGKGISLSLIKSMGMTQGLTDAQLQAIVTAVGP